MSLPLLFALSVLANLASVLLIANEVVKDRLPTDNIPLTVAVVIILLASSIQFLILMGVAA